MGRTSKTPVLSRRHAAAAGALLLLAACNPPVQGNGILNEESRDVAAFTGVRVGDGVSAHVTIGSPQSVRVVADSNLISYIRTDVDPVLVGTAQSAIPVLRVWVDRAYEPTITPSVVITIPSLSFARIEDGSTAELKKLAAASMRVEASARGAVTLVGPGGGFVGDLLDVVLSDASLDAGSYPVIGARVALTGASRAELDASGWVVGTAAGSSVVDDLLGGGPCYVSTTGSAKVACHL